MRPQETRPYAGVCMIPKQILPTSLFGRALLILVLPTVFIQVVMAYIFFDRHWDNVSRHMGKALAGEAAYLVRQLEKKPVGPMPVAVRDFDAVTDIDIYLDSIDSFPADLKSPDYPEFKELLRDYVAQPFMV